MNFLNNMYMVYAFITVMNAVISFVMWKNTKDELYGLQFKYWVTLIVYYTLFGILDPSEPYIAGLVFLTGALPFWFITRLVAKLTKQTISSRHFFTGVISAIVLSTLSQLLKLHYVFVLLPISLGVIYSGSIVSYRVVTKTWGHQSFLIKGLIVSMILQSIHVINFAFLYPISESRVVGFAIGFCLVFAHTFFSFGAVVEQIANDKQRLEASLYFKAQITHATRLSALGEMAGGLAHEINNPLQALFVNSGLMRRLFPLQSIEYKLLGPKLDKMDGLIDRISNITSGLLSFSANNDNEAKIPVSVEKIVTDTLLLCRKNLENSGVSLLTNLTPDLSVEARPMEIQRALLNLISNARDAALASKEKLVTLKVSAQNKNVLIEVSNTGAAIPEEIQYRIFEPFYTTKDVDAGTGLGLSITKGIVEAHAGTIVHLREDGLTKFTITLPRMIS